MLRAVGKSEQPRTVERPGLHLRHGGLEQGLCNALILQVRLYGERAEETDAALARDEIRTHQFALAVRGQRDHMGRGAAGPHVIPIGEELLRIRRAQPAPERRAKNPLGGGLIVRQQWRYGDWICSVHEWRSESRLQRGFAWHDIATAVLVRHDSESTAARV